jgi:hypothetical protein
MSTGKVTKGVNLGGSLVLVPADEDTTTTTVAPTPTPDDTTTTTETASETTTADTTTTTEAPTTTTTTAPVTTTTDATTETTTVYVSSGSSHSGGGGGGRTTTTTTTEATTEATTAVVEDDTEATTSKVSDIKDHLNINTEDVRENPGFTDLGGYGWAEDDINALYRLGLLDGIGNNLYGPALGCKRGDFAILINNILGLDIEPTKNFDDNADPSKYYYNACRVGYTAGILSGYGDNNYKPEKYCSREEMFVLVAKTLEFLGEDVTSTDLSVNDKYNDVESISWWSAPYCAFLTDNGIIGGTAAGNAEPQRNINRAEMAVMMYRDYQYIVNKYGKSLMNTVAEAEEETIDNGEYVDADDSDATVDETSEENTDEATESTVSYGRGKSTVRTSTATSTVPEDTEDEEEE